MCHFFLVKKKSQRDGVDVMVLIDRNNHCCCNIVIGQLVYIIQFFDHQEEKKKEKRIQMCGVRRTKTEQFTCPFNSHC